MLHLFLCNIIYKINNINIYLNSHSHAIIERTNPPNFRNSFLFEPIGGLALGELKLVDQGIPLNPARILLHLPELGLQSRHLPPPRPNSPLHLPFGPADPLKPPPALRNLPAQSLPLSPQLFQFQPQFFLPLAAQNVSAAGGIEVGQERLQGLGGVVLGGCEGLLELAQVLRVELEGLALGLEGF